MVIGILSAGILAGIVIGVMIKYIIDGVFGKDGKALKELQAENDRLRSRIKDLERGK